MFIEWKSCAQGGDSEFARGAVVQNGHFIGLVWAFDDQTATILPIHGNKTAKLRQTVSLDRRILPVVGSASKISVAALSAAFDIELISQSDWLRHDEAFGEWCPDVGSGLTPTGRDGWQPMSKVDGTYWRRYRHPAYDGT